MRARIKKWLTETVVGLLNWLGIDVVAKDRDDLSFDYA